MTIFLLSISLLTMLGSLYCHAEPLNAAVKVGTSMSMNCGSASNDETVQWRFRNPHTGLLGETILYDGSSVYGESSISITKSQDIVTLTKSKIRPEDAGIYTCFVTANNKPTIARSAELIVLVSDPICQSSLGNDSLGVKEDKVVELQCNVSFFGKDLHPVMIWYRNNDEKLKPQYVTQTETSFFQKVKLQMKASDNGIVFSCLLHFESRSNASFHQPTVIRAKNSPEYNFRWNFSASVSYGPRNMIFENLKMSYEYGDIILCRAEGNPTPDYKWISLTNSVFINGSSLTISSDYMAPGDTYSYQCIAINSKSGTNTSKAINITIGIPVEWSVTKIITLNVGITAGILFVVLIALKAIRLRGSDRTTSNKENNARKRVHFDSDSRNGGDRLQVFHGQPVDGNAVDVPPANDNPEHSTNPRNAEVTSYVELIGDDVIEDCSSEVVEMEGTFPYSKLNVNRALPIPPIYAQLETEYLKPADSQVSMYASSKGSLDRYTNIDDTFTASDTRMERND